MKRKWLAILILPLFFMGCAAMGSMNAGEGKDGGSSPVIANSFASKEIRPGETWKVYLAAQDADGDMKNIVCTVDQPGVGVYPVSITRIKPENQRAFSGYIYLFTGRGAGLLNWVNLTLNVQIQDRQGRYSAPVSFPLSMNSRSRQEPPPRDAFQEKDLGPIMIQIRTFQDGAGTDQDW